jgi:general secretion pathway protein A
LSRLNNYLMTRSREDLTTALVVDESQLLSWDLLEEIRLLTNLETTQHKLLQIVLAGQPELDSKLDSHQLRQLKQRVGLRCNLLPLELKDMEGYIHRRLEVAGAKGNENPIFSRESIDAIYAFSKGIPRLINTLCENSLMLGYGLQLAQITPAVVREVASDFRLDPSAVSPEVTETVEGPRIGLKFLHQPKREDAHRSGATPIDRITFLPKAKSE